MDMRFRLGLAAVLGLAVLVGVVAGRSQSQSSAAPAPPTQTTPLPKPSVGEILIIPSSAGLPPATYRPSVLSARVGEKLTWINRTDIAHSAIADNGAFNANVVGPGQSYTWTPSSPGRYTYGDFFFPEMRGEIDVSS
jgi:plastocyanin